MKEWVFAFSWGCGGGRGSDEYSSSEIVGANTVSGVSLFLSVSAKRQVVLGSENYYYHVSYDHSIFPQLFPFLNYCDIFAFTVLPISSSIFYWKLKTPFICFKHLIFLNYVLWWLSLWQLEWPKECPASWVKHYFWVFLWECFWKTLGFDSVDKVKSSALSNVGGHHPVCWV